MKRAWRDSNPQPSGKEQWASPLLVRLRYLDWLVGALEAASVARVYSFEEAARARGQARVDAVDVGESAGGARVIALHPVVSRRAEG